MRGSDELGKDSYRSEAWSGSEHIFKVKLAVLLMDYLWDVRKQGL